jgi:copper chaperone CopZ
MKKRFQLEDLDCANCAAKLERAIQGVDGVIAANVNFMTQKLTIEIADEDFDAVWKVVKKTAKKADRDITIVE